MTELKTLKDFKRDITTLLNYGIMPSYIDAGDNNIVPYESLKQEAIKRVKYYSGTIKEFFVRISKVTGKVTSCNKGDDLDSIQKLNMGAIIELIEFFNITDEDLK